MGQRKQLSKILSGSLMVSGTAIGAGMLALPLATAEGGFLPALVLYAICWFFSVATGLLMLEVTLTLPEGANLISMSANYLGRAGKLASWILYLFLFYCLTIAYIAGGARLFNMFLPFDSYPMAIGIFTALFGGVVFLGAYAVDRTNKILMAGLIVAYCLFISLGLPKVETRLLTALNFSMAIAGLPVIFTSFSYQGILPTLTEYMGRDRRAIRFAILIGASLPFGAYLLWDLLIKGIIPVPALVEARQLGLSAVEPLSRYVLSPYVFHAGSAFAFFALTTSFLGVTLGLMDFLSDGLNIKKSTKNRFGLALMIYLPGALIAGTDPHVFFKALEYAGGIGCVLLLGLIPILMCMKKRYQSPQSQRELGGGQGLLWLLILFIIFELGVTLS
jgi:tyrosine-specific transport protein